MYPFELINVRAHSMQSIYLFAHENALKNWYIAAINNEMNKPFLCYSNKTP